MHHHHTRASSHLSLIYTKLAQISAQSHQISSSSSHACMISYGFMLIYHNFITFYHILSRICAKSYQIPSSSHLLELGFVEFYQISSFPSDFTPFCKILSPILHHFLQQISSFKGILLANLKSRRSEDFLLVF